MLKDMENIKKYLIMAIVGILIFTFSMITINFLISTIFMQKESAEENVKTGKLARAIEHYKNLVTINPNNYNAHIKLGKLYEEVNEPTRAKIEYFKALKLPFRKRYEANFALANLYLKNGETELAIDLIEQIEDDSKKVLDKKAEFYTNTAKTIYLYDTTKALRLLKKSCTIHKKVKSKNTKYTEKVLNKVALYMVQNLTAGGQKEEAIKTLENALKCSDSHILHTKLAILYENTDIEKSLEHTKQAYELKKSKDNKQNYYNLLVKAAKIHEENGNKTKSKYYYFMAHKYKTGDEVPFFVDQTILLNILSTDFNRDDRNGQVFPGVTFKITNVSQNELDYLAGLVVFSIDGQIFNKSKVQIADEDEPLGADSKTAAIKVFSSRPIFEEYLVHPIKVQVYLSKKEMDEWVLYRNTYIINQ